MTTYISLYDCVFIYSLIFELLTDKYISYIIYTNSIYISIYYNIPFYYSIITVTLCIMYYIIYSYRYIIYNKKKIKFTEYKLQLIVPVTFSYKQPYSIG